MNRLLPDAAYSDLAASLDPPVVSAYLAATGTWQLENRHDNISEFWSLTEDGEPRGRIMLPLATDYGDFQRRFTEALAMVGRVYDWDAAELARHIRSARADLLYIRLDHGRHDETIPLREAEAAIDAVYEMLKATAVTAAAPTRTQRGGRLPAAVASFLDENVRLGHTQPGSFVFTVASRLDDPAGAPPPESSPAHAMTPFPRKVMETLARGLEATRDLTAGGADDVLANPAQWGLSAGLVESLETMVQPPGLRSLQLSFQWAAAVPQPDVGNEPVLIDHAAADDLARIRERLLLDEEPPHRETLVGPVVSLARDDSSLEVRGTGSIIIAAEVNGRKRNVHMVLSGPDHDRAISSYQLRLPLIVTGDLSFERRAWRLSGDLEVDASLLQHAAGVRRDSLH